MFAKLKALFQNTAGRAMNKGTMKATSLAMAEMINADGKVDDNELVTAKNIFKRNPKLAVFGAESIRELDSALDMWEESARQARATTNRSIEEWMKGATAEDKEDLMISLLDLMDSDGEVDPAELRVAEKYAGLTGLSLASFEA